MRRALQQLLYSLPVTAGARLDRSLRVSGVKRAQFVSYLKSSGYRTPHLDSHDRSVRRRRFVKTSLLWLTAFAAAWFVLESAKAIVVS